MKKAIFLLIAIALMNFSCKDKPAEPVNTTHLFQGVVVTDDMGNMLGNFGTDDGDWGHDLNWTAEESQLLNFPDSINLDGTFPGDTTGQPPGMTAFFPNPTSSVATLHLKVTGSMKFKMTIVDNKFISLFTYCKKFPQGVYSIELPFSDTAVFVHKEIYRMYYRFSFSGNPDYYKGHGDIMICRSGSQFDCVHW